jgi:DNA (cytosine-5)-methyltransferase 1
VALRGREGGGTAELSDVPSALRASQGGGDKPHVLTMAVGADCYNGSLTGDVAATMGTTGSGVNGAGPTLMQGMRVRRLTPIECERLQGFPDNYTRIPYRGKDADKCPDGPRYKALGNSMAVPVMRWIGRQIDGVMA